MKREEWAQLARRLTWPGAMAQLQCDQYLVTLKVQRDGMRMVIAVYVDGWMKGEWITKDCEERRRFFRPKLIRPKAYTPAQIRLLGKKWCADQLAKYTYTFFTPIWPSVAALRRHFEKQNASVELAVVEAEVGT